MKVLIFVAFLTLGFNGLSEGLKISCEYRIDSETNLYTCEAKVILTNELRTVEGSITGYHLQKKNNAKVEVFSIKNQKGFSQFPLGVFKQLKKVKKVVVVNTDIKEITKTDLKPLKNVEIEFKKSRTIIAEEKLDELLSRFNDLVNTVDVSKASEKLKSLEKELKEFVQNFDIFAFSDAVTKKLNSLLNALKDFVKKFNDSTTTATTPTTTTIKAITPSFKDQLDSLISDLLNKLNS